MRKTKKKSQLKRADTPLTADIKNGILTIQVGVNVLAFAYENLPLNTVDDGDKVVSIINVHNPLGFAREVLEVMCQEKDDGETRLSGFLDTMCIAAHENGDIFVDHVLGKDGKPKKRFGEN